MTAEAPKTGIAAMAADSPLVSTRRCGGDGVECFDLPCRSILNRTTSSRVPFDLTLNPYRGCEFGCTYCYARYTHEFMDLSPARDFERKIYAKRGAAAALARELRSPAARRGPIAIGTATDPYQPLERRLGLMREILHELAKHRGLTLSITTKSDLVTRDVDLLAAIAERNAIHVNVTVTTLDANLARTLEPRAPTPENRLRAIERLAGAGVQTALSVAPILPFITDDERDLDALLGAGRAAGARDAWTQVLFLRDCSRPTFFDWLAAVRPDLVERYRTAYASDYAPEQQKRLQRLAAHLVRKHRFPGLDDRIPLRAYREDATSPPADPSGSRGLDGRPGQLRLFA
jgi:DNA repair photolyase